MSNIRIWQSVFKLKNDIGLNQSVIRNWEDYRWILTACPKTLSGEFMYQLFEFNDDFETKIGFSSIVVSENELDKLFSFVLNVDLN